MPFSSGDDVRILKAMSLSKSDLEAIATAMDSLDESLIDSVKQAVSAVEEAQALLAAEFNTSNYALIQADVLVWSDKAKASGILLNLYYLKMQLSRLLEIAANTEFEESLLSSAGYGVGSSGIIRTSRN